MLNYKCEMLNAKCKVQNIFFSASVKVISETFSSLLLETFCVTG